MLHKAVVVAAAVGHNIAGTIDSRLLVVLWWAVDHHSIVHNRLVADLEQRRSLHPQLCCLWSRPCHRQRMQVEQHLRLVRDLVVGSCIDSQDIVDNLHKHSLSTMRHRPTTPLYVLPSFPA